MNKYNRLLEEDAVDQYLGDEQDSEEIYGEIYDSFVNGNLSWVKEKLTGLGVEGLADFTVYLLDVMQVNNADVAKILKLVK